MGEHTRIPWCHHTFNPWHGCTKVSEGCKHCYAEAMARRWKLQWGHDYRFFGEPHWAGPLKWDRDAAEAGERRRVFCGSMCDVFDARVGLKPHRKRLFGLIERTPHLDWLLLTKRPRNILGLDMVPESWLTKRGFPRHVWIGTTCETQRRADERLRVVLTLPAWVIFVSAEPLLEELLLQPYLDGSWHSPTGRRLDWIIAGAESGPGRRPMDEAWVRRIRDDAVRANVPFFYKQRAERHRMVHMPWIGARQWAEVPKERQP